MAPLIAHLDEHDTSSLGASLAPQSNCKHVLSHELAKKGTHELEELFKSAACGEARGEDNSNSSKDGGEDNGNGSKDGGKDNGSGGDNNNSDNDDDDDDGSGSSEDRGGIPTAMNTKMPVLSAKAWINNYILQALQKTMGPQCDHGRDHLQCQSLDGIPQVCSHMMAFDNNGPGSTQQPAALVYPSS
ncbi:hypothetical protein EDB84DRAFT_1435862 [Lactarius hengduanensis]|nr:hypothetical protein EDB84DRAFT_1435862 [Lactarius hengduanensis]